MSKQQSVITKRYKQGAIWTEIASFILLAGPLTYYLVKAFIQAEPHQKLALGLAGCMAVILGAINIMMKLNLRSTVWVVLLGISFVLDHLQTLLILMSISTLVDELVLTPLHKHCKSNYSINREIDKRC